MPKRAVKEMTTEDRLRASLKQAGETGAVVPPPPKEEDEAVPDLAELIQDRKARLEMFRLLAEERQVAEVEAEAKKTRKPLTAKIKTILGTFKVRRALWEGWSISYYVTDGRTKVDLEKMTTALLTLGLSTDQIYAVKSACVSQGNGNYTLRISRPGEKEEE